MFKYKARVVRVVDGDTFDAVVDLGFKTTTKQRFRLKGVDTPETWRPTTNSEKEHGERAKTFVSNLIAGKEVTLTSVKSAVYNRWEAYVELENGTDLGTLLINAKLVKLEEYKD